MPQGSVSGLFCLYRSNDDTVRYIFLLFNQIVCLSIYKNKLTTMKCMSDVSMASLKKRRF